MNLLLYLGLLFIGAAGGVLLWLPTYWSLVARIDELEEKLPARHSSGRFASKTPAREIIGGEGA